MRGRNVGMWWGTAIEAPDPRVLAEFYSSMLDWPVTHADDQVAIITPLKGPFTWGFNSPRTLSHRSGRRLPVNKER